MNEIPQRELKGPTGRIITFYSYKGGTGRSMAVANVAWILASQGSRVLVIDWDFEAPGLHQYFRPFLDDKDLSSSQGLIDFFIEFVEAARLPRTTENGTGSEWFHAYANLLPFAYSLECKFTNHGTIDFVPAGRQGTGYAERVMTLDWQSFYDKLGGGVFLEAVKKHLRIEYDYILIDSRTGISDTSGICTVQMPDDLVVCFTLNNQSIQGAAAVAESATFQRRKPSGQSGLKIWPVPTRVELGEKKKLEAARANAHSAFNSFLISMSVSTRKKYWDAVETLYHPWYAYEEVLAVYGDQPGVKTSLLTAAEALTGYLTHGAITAAAVPSEEERQRVSEQLASSVLPEFINDVFVAFHLADSERVMVELIQPLREAGLTVHVAFQNFRLGESLKTSFEKALLSCRHTLIVLTPTFIVDSAFSELEAVYQAMHEGSKSTLNVIPILFQSCTPPHWLTSVSSVDLTDSRWRAEETALLLRHLGANPRESVPSLFFSYRRSDSIEIVKHIYERIKLWLPRWDIFFEQEPISLGEQFPDRLLEKVRSATVVLVFIGPRWLSLLNECKTSTDYVRNEIRLALTSKATVIPVLVGNATLPTGTDLLDYSDLKPLLDLQALNVRSDPDFDYDLETIVGHLKSRYEAEAAGTVIDDKYVLTGNIGEGSVGIVYAAQQKWPVRRMVAIKVIKPGMDSRNVLARFDIERQALAILDHPNIARVLDAGTALSGRPYFVIEYVKGISITRYCDHEKLTIQERLKLFISVCNAIQHAHQKGIIHRDMKPSNVLVEIVDGKPQPKVIDFGLAKALYHKLTEETNVTEVGHFIGTMQYSAPEQTQFNNHDVDTRVDIYSLGVMLYELLTGSLPFTIEHQLSPHYEIMKAIQEAEPDRPSKKIESLLNAPSISALRSVEPMSLMRQLRGDLDWIVMKCLEKERSRRYNSANDLAMDLQRFLGNETVQARPPSLWYIISKFVKRNRGLVGALSFSILLMLVSFVVILIGYHALLQTAGVEREAKQEIEVAAQKTRETMKPFLSEWYEVMIAKENAMSADAKAKLLESLEMIVHIYEYNGDTVEADRWRKEIAKRRLPKYEQHK